MGQSRHRSASIRTGTDLEYCRAKFKTAWARIRAGWTHEVIAKAREMRQ